MTLTKKILITTFAWLGLGLSLSVYAFPKVDEWETDEGARVLYVHAPEIPMLDIRVSIAVGSFHEAQQYGLAAMTASLLTKETEYSDEEALMTRLEDLGTSIQMSAGTEQSTISYRSLTDQVILDHSLNLLTEIIQKPRFGEKVFERERTQIIDAQKARLDNINAIADEIYYEKLYPNQYLGTTSEMLQSALKVLKPQQLKEFREKYYHATGAKIILVGDLDKLTALKISQKISAALGRGTPAKNVEETPLQTEKKTYTKFFDSPQTRILIGHPSINRFDEDYFPLILGNHVLGGSGLTSQLMINIREKQGLTYGINSRFNPSFLHGPFTIGLSTKNENVDHAITETEKLLATFIQQGPDEESLQRAKNNLIGSMALDLDSNAKIAGALLGIAVYNLPLDYYDTYSGKIKAITKDDIQKAFAKHVHPTKMITVIVGGEQK